MSPDHARLLWDRAAAVRPGGQIVEIGSYRGRSMIVLASAAAPEVTLVAIDPHAGNDRGPQQWEGTSREGEEDNAAFWSNLERAQVATQAVRVGDEHGGVRDPLHRGSFRRVVSQSRMPSTSQ